MLINRAACKKAILAVAEDTRSHKFTRVGSDTLEYLEADLLNTIKDLVRRHPSLGKTIMMESKKCKKDD
jgi:hypothetical protein